jgi:uncharacterized protein
MHPSLRTIAHRPWPLPTGPWVLAQNWHNLLFAHWPVPAERLRPLVPEALEMDVFRGTGWISVVPFTMSGVRLRATPSLPWLSAFPELNVRTYVVTAGRPGVWFFSLDAANRLAVEIARTWFHLPYLFARMSSSLDGETVDYASLRCDPRGGIAELGMRYVPTGPARKAKEGTLEYFLSERYCLYAQKPNGELLRSEIHHAPWFLRDVTASFEVNSMASALGLELSSPPAMMHFSKLQEVVVWRPEKLTR